MTNSPVTTNSITSLPALGHAEFVHDSEVYSLTKIGSQWFVHRGKTPLSTIHEHEGDWRVAGANDEVGFVTYPSLPEALRDATGRY